MVPRFSCFTSLIYVVHRAQNYERTRSNVKAETSKQFASLYGTIDRLKTYCKGARFGDTDIILVTIEDGYKYLSVKVWGLPITWISFPGPILSHAEFGQDILTGWRGDVLLSNGEIWDLFRYWIPLMQLFFWQRS